MRRVMAEAEESGNRHFSHFGPEANLFAELEETFRSYGASGSGRTRHYEEEERKWGAPPGTFTEWEEIPAGSNLLFYEGIHGALVTDEVDVAQHADLKIGVVPVVNLEWIQKLWSYDSAIPGTSTSPICWP